MAADPDAVTMNISLPGPLKRFVDGKVSSGIYGSASEFVREAIREKLQRERDHKEAQEALVAKLREGLNSGDPIPFDDAYGAQKKKKLLERMRRTNGRT